MTDFESTPAQFFKSDDVLEVDKVAIRRQLEELKKIQKSLEEMLAAGEGNSKEPSGDIQRADPDGSSARDERSTARAPKGRPLRAVVLDALQDLGCPAYSRELSLYCKARYGREIPATRFGTLAADEQRAYARPTRQPRSLWLCFALTFDRYQPIKRLMARSDWELADRIVAPTSGRVQHLRMTIRLCEIALETGDTAADPEMMRIIAADHARDLPDIKIRRGEFHLERWRDAAEAMLRELIAEDEHIRQSAAKRLVQMPEHAQLFGTFDVIEGGRTDRQGLRGEA